MPFDFKGGAPSSSGAPFPPSSSGGGFKDKPGGSGSRPADRPSAPPSPSGFRDRPGRSVPSSEPTRGATPPAAPRPRPVQPVRWPSVRSPKLSLPSLPLDRLIPLLAVVGLLVFCFVFREAIKAFLKDLLTWAIILLVIIIIFKRLLFGGKH